MSGSITRCPFCSANSCKSITALSGRLVADGLRLPSLPTNSPRGELQFEPIDLGPQDVPFSPQDTPIRQQALETIPLADHAAASRTGSEAAEEAGEPGENPGGFDEHWPLFRKGLGCWLRDTTARTL